MLPLVGDGLLPAYIDGKQKPKNDDIIPLVGTQDDGAFYGATFNALNIFDLTVKWRSTPVASLTLNTQLPVASFDSIFPCTPTPRDCLPQPGITDPNQKLDVLSYRQRPTHRLAYRNMKTYDTMVTGQAVEATPGMAGMRWYEIRRVDTSYALHQQGTYAPTDGIHRWMGRTGQAWLVTLEAVAGVRLRIPTEACRPHHQHGVGCLRVRGRMAVYRHVEHPSDSDFSPSIIAFMRP